MPRITGSEIYTLTKIIMQLKKNIRNLHTNHYHAQKLSKIIMPKISKLSTDQIWDYHAQKYQKLSCPKLSKLSTLLLNKV
jgi:hypothetical protein